MRSVLPLCVISLLCLPVQPAHSQFNGLMDKATGADKCKPDDEACQRQKKMLGVAATVVISAAAKLIAEMAIKAKSEQVNDEGTVVKEYRRQFKSLPEAPIARQYEVNAQPGNVIEPAIDVRMSSTMVIVPSSARPDVLVEERLTIYDNDDNTKPLRSSRKIVNEQTRRGGRFKNEFSFAFPNGVPQGIYPITTELLLDGKPVQSQKNDLQLVLVIDARGEMRLAARGVSQVAVTG